MAKKVLVVEDDTIVQKTIIESLKDAGFDVSGAFDGEEGLAKAATVMPDLILLDIIMPKMDGIAFLKQIKTMENLKNIPIVILTNLSDEESVSESLASGGTEYLVKSNYTIDEVVQKVKARFGME